MASAVIKTVLRPPLTAALQWRARWSSRPHAVVLVYHATRPGPCAGEPVVPELAASALATHLRVLRARYEPVAAGDVLAAAARRRRGGRLPVAITFDDDERSHLEIAAPLLLEHGVPATFFLTGAGLGGGAHWWHGLQAARDRGTPVPPASTVERLAPAERRALIERLGDPGPLHRALDASEIARLAGHGFEIGFHTRDHDKLTELDDEALAGALRAGRAELEAVTGRPLRLIAYPHGAADGRVAAAARAAGFELGFITAMGPVTPAAPALLLNRPELLTPSGARFAFDLIRLAGREP